MKTSRKPNRGLTGKSRRARAHSYTGGKPPETSMRREKRHREKMAKIKSRKERKNEKKKPSR
jgi:hypothetical protein